MAGGLKALSPLKDFQSVDEQGGPAIAEICHKMRLEARRMVVEQPREIGLGQRAGRLPSGNEG